MVEESVLHMKGRPKPPRHCIVRFGNGDLPGILLEWRPKVDRGGLSRYEGLVVYASQDHGPRGDWSVATKWLDGDLIKPVPGTPPPATT